MRKLLLPLLLLLCTCALLAQQTVTERSSSIVTIGGESYYVHTVSKGETLWSLSRLYSMSEEDLIRNNPMLADGVQEGVVLKVPVVKEPEPKLSARKQNRLFDKHQVQAGETLYSISRKYEIPVSTILEDNEGLDPSLLSIGQVINIRKKSIGDATPEQIDQEINRYVDAANSISSDTTFHLVERGETLYGLSRHYGVTEDDILRVNNLHDGLKAGAVIKIPVKPAGHKDVVSPDGKIADRDSIPGVIWPWGQSAESKNDVTVRDFSRDGKPVVALLLPLKDENGKGNRNFLDFYQGVLIALEDLKAEGVSATLNLFNTGRSKRATHDIVESSAFREANLIIGPVYEDNAAAVIDYAGSQGIPVVSPLANFQQEGSPVLYQMAPSPSTKFDKLRTEIIAGADHIIYITTSSPDEELEKELRPTLPEGTQFVPFTSSKSFPIDKYINRAGRNVIIVSSTNELTVEGVLASISSMQTNLVARSLASGQITVVGSSRWARFRSTIDKDLFFKLNVSYINSYHADRSSHLVMRFDRRYISSFGSLPSPYSYRGYDAAKLFIGASTKSGSNFTDKLNAGTEVLLEMPYHFSPSSRGGSHINDQWALVCYQPDYTIVVK